MNGVVKGFGNFLLGRTKTYELLNKDKVVLEFSVERATESIENVRWVDAGLRPIGFTDLKSFLGSRKAPSNRSHIKQVLDACGANTFSGYLDVVHALSVNDTFWVRRRHEEVSWEEANLYDNELNEALSRIAFEGGLVGQSLDLSSPTAEPSLGGSFAKCVIRRDGRLYILKAPLSISHEAGAFVPKPEAWHPWSEVMAHQVAQALGIDSVRYSLVERRSRRLGRVVPATLCPLFTSAEIGFVPARLWLGTGEADYSALLSAYKSVGSEDEFRKMLVLDALTMNPDRHMGNHGVLFDTETLEVVGMAPVFDNNLSFYPGRRLSPAEDFYRSAREELRPAIGGDFLLVAREAMTPAIRKQVANLANFRFDRHALRGMPEERIDVMERILAEQVAVLTSEPSGRGFNLQREQDIELDWQLVGWPDDDLPATGQEADRDEDDAVADPMNRTSSASDTTEDR